MNTGRNGFTLVEIMAALAILGLAMFMLLQAHYGSLRLFEESRRQVLIRELGAKAMGIAETELTAGNAVGSNEFGKRYPQCKYRFEAAPVSETFPNLYELRVEIEGPDWSRELQQLVFLPRRGQ